MELAVEVVTTDVVEIEEVAVRGPREGSALPADSVEVSL